MSHFLSLETPIRLAHRGSRILWPENTMVAFQGAIDLGYQYLELDVRVTADDVVVVHHDATLERTTSRGGEIAGLTYAEIVEADAGHHFGAGQGFPYRGRGVTVPTLEEVFLAWPDAHLNIDLKSAKSEWAVADILTRLEKKDQVMIGSFAGSRLARFRRITRGRVATSVGPAHAAAMWVASRLRRVARHPAQAFQMPYDYRAFPIDRLFVDAVHESGAHFHVWTVDEPHDMRRMLDLGVDGIVTDRPDLLNEVLADGE